METVGEKKKVVLPKLTPITEKNNRILSGSIKVVDSRWGIQFKYQFESRLERKQVNDFINQTFYDKLKNNSWYISIIIDDEKS